MDALTQIALAKAMKTAAVRAASDSLSAGDYEVDALVRIQGIVSKGEDEEVVPTVSLSLLETLALTLHYAGVTRESAMAAIRKAATEALTDSTKTAGVLSDRYDWIEPLIKEIKGEVLQTLPKVPKIGRVRTKLKVEAVEEVEAVDAEKVEAGEPEVV